MTKRLTKRWGVPLSILVQIGEAPVPPKVRYSCPSLCPTTIKSELPGETAIALMGGVGFGVAPGAGGRGATAALMLVQVGVGLAVALALLVRQRLIPPARSVFGSPGSITSGAIKFELAEFPASEIPAGMLLKVTPALVLRKMARLVFSL